MFEKISAITSARFKTSPTLVLMKITRPLNLVIIALTQFLTYRYLLVFNPTNSNFSIDQLILLILSSIFSAAAGNVINDIFDVEIDKINKPHKVLINNGLDIKKVWFFYALLVFFSLVFATFFDLQIGGLWLIFYQIFFNILLFLYSKYLKKMPFVGNFVVSFLCAMVVIIVVFASELIDENRIADQFIWLYAGFAFLSTMFREIIKDIEDMEGDKALNSKTLPILFGVNASKFVAILVLVGLSFLVLLTTASPKFQIIGATLLIACLALAFQTFRATEKAHFHRISQVTKGVMLLGLGYLIL